MESSILLLFYALSSWGAGLNCQAWSRSLIRCWTAPRRKPWWRDNTVLIRVGLVLLSSGVFGLAGIRLWGAVINGEAISVPSPWGILFIGLMASAEPFFLMVDENDAREEGRHSVVWRLYWAGTVSLIIFFLVAAICGSI